jgi:hypothetical protein
VGDGGSVRIVLRRKSSFSDGAMARTWVPLLSQSIRLCVTSRILAGGNPYHPRLSEDQITDDQIAEDQITEDQITKDLITEDLITEDQIASNQIALRSKLGPVSGQRRWEGGSPKGGVSEHTQSLLDAVVIVEHWRLWSMDVHLFSGSFA